ncbi:MAG: OmpA family protein, partial [Pseudomonadota bacterium]
MKSILLKSSPLLLAIAVAGCDTSSLLQTAGETNAASRAFGGANANNTVAQSAYLKGGILADLSNSFRAAAPDMINFAFNSSELDAEARSILDRQAAWISANPAIRFRVYGHTDKVGSNAYNQRLGLRRAQAAVRYLVSRGVPRNKLEAVASFGETRPLVDTQNRERLNRRTVTEVVGFAR